MSECLLPQGSQSSENTKQVAYLDSSTEHKIDIETGLINALNELKTDRFSEGFQIPIYLLASVDANINGEFEKRLKEATENNCEKRIVLIPYHVENSHWIGILLGFKESQNIRLAEYIDPVSNSQFVSDKIQKEFNRYYYDHNVILSSKNLETRDNPTKSAQLTIRNLIKRAEELQSIESNDSNSLFDDSKSREVIPTAYESRGAQSKVSNLDSPRRPLTTDSDLNNIKSTDETNFSSLMLSTEQQIEEYQVSETRDFSSSTSDDETEYSNRIVQEEDFTNEESTENLDNYFLYMPECSEKSMAKLMHLCTQLLMNEAVILEDNIVTANSRESEMKKELECLKQRLQIEELQSSLIKRSIEKIGVDMKVNNWKSIYMQLEEMSKLTSPLNIHQLFRLIDKVKDAAKLVKGEHIILLLGNTGSGKSTTVHFVGGSKFEQRKVNGVSHLYPIDIKNPDLRKITTSPSAQSETQYITPVRIFYKDVGVEIKDSILVCDSPGFKDNRGPEVDIANGVGIIKAIRRCTSVKIVILISYMSLGDRFDGVKDLARLLSGMMRDVKDNLDRFTYIFTKYPTEKRDEIHSLLINAYNTLSENDKRNTIFVDLLRDMIDKTRDKTLTLDPLEDDPRVILRALDKAGAIKNPKEVFIYSVADGSNNTLKDQLEKDKTNIKSAIKRFDYLFIKYKLDQLKRLNQIFRDENIKRVYDDCIEYICEPLSKEYDGAVSIINNFSESKIILTDENIRNYKTCIDHAKLAEQLRETHLGEKVVHWTKFIQQLNNVSNVRLEQIREKEINDPLVKINLDTVKFILDSFKDIDIDRKKYHFICQYFTEKLEFIVSSFQNSVSLNKFDQSEENIKKMYEALNSLQDHLDRAQMQEKYDGMRQYFLNHLNNPVENLYNIFNKEKIDNDEIENLKTYISMLESVKKASTFQLYISKENIANELYNDFLSKIFNRFEKIVQRINFELEDENGFSKLEPFLDELDLIRNISIIELKTNQMYGNLLNKIFEYLHNLKVDTEQSLKDLSQSEIEINYDKVQKYLHNLETAAWTKKYRNKEYSLILTEVKQQLTEHMNIRKKYIMEVNLDIENYDQIETIYKIVLNWNKMKYLENFVPNINQYLDEIHRRFQYEINKVCSSIKSSFDIDILKEQNFQVIDFNKVERSFRYLDACQRSHFSFENDCTLIWNDLKKFIDHYSCFIREEIKMHFETMNNLGNIDKEKISETCRVLSNRLIEVFEIKQNYSYVFSSFSHINIEHWQKELSRYQIELEHEIANLYNTRQINSLENKLTTVKILIRFDRFLEGNKYSDIHSEYYEKLLQLQKRNDFCKNVADAIKEHDYMVVAREIEVLESSTNVAEDFYEKIKQILNQGFDDLIEDTERQATEIQYDLEIELIKSIAHNIKRIENAKRYVSKYVDTSNKLDKYLNKVKSTIMRTFRLILDKVKELVNVDGIYHVDQKISLISEAHILLGNYCDTKIFDDIQAIKEEQKRIILNDIGEKYLDMDLDNYSLCPPKALIIKIEEAKKTNNLFERALEKIKESIYSKFRRKLQEAKSETYLNINSSHIIMLESAVRYLPEDMRRVLEQELSHCKHDIEIKIKQNNDNLEQAVNNGDVKTMKNLLEEYKNSEGMQSFFNKGHNLILNKVISVVDRIKMNFDQGQFIEALEDVKIFYQYKSELQPFVKSIADQHLKLQNCIDTQFQDAQNSFINTFLGNNTSEIIPNINDIIEKKFLCLVAFIKFSDESNDQLMLSNILPQNFDKCVRKLNSKTSDYLANLKNKYIDGLEILDVTSFKDILDFTLRWDSLLTKIRNIIRTYNLEDTSIKSMINAIRELPNYQSVSQSISRKYQTLIDEINKQICIYKIEDSSTNFDTFYKEISKKLSLLDATRLLNKHHLTININTEKEKCLELIRSKVRNIYSYIEQFLDNFSKDIELSTEDYNRFDSYYLSFLSIRTEISKICQDINEKLVKIKEKILEKIDSWKVVERDSSVDTICTYLIKMKRATCNIRSFTSQINVKIDQVLNDYKSRTKNSEDFSKLYVTLIRNLSNIGQLILVEHKAFKGYEYFLFNKKIQPYPIDKLISRMELDNIGKKTLRKSYDEFQDKYNNLINQYVKPRAESNDLSSNAKQIAEKLIQKPSQVKWNASVRDTITSLLAYIFALWTLNNSEHCFDIIDLEEKKRYLVKPHQTQIVSILCMLGINDKKEHLKNRVVEIGIGEGKSLIVAVTACVLALLGFDIRCVCYNEDLCQRSSNEFSYLFQTLGITEYIRYVTFNKLCEELINENGRTCQLIKQLVLSNSNHLRKDSRSNERAKILLIDEVGVFLNQDMCDNVYAPSASLSDPTITSLINYIWKERRSNLSLDQVKRTNEYRACRNRFSNWETLIIEAVKDLIFDLKTFESHDYVVKEDKIGYRKHDEIVYDIVYGYKTLFAYYYEHENNQITRTSLEEKISLNIRCGSFLYAKIHKQFEYIMCVTGSFKTLSQAEKDIISYFKLEQSTFIPSLFSTNKFKFNKDNDIIVENIHNYFKAIGKEIDKRAIETLEVQRAIFIFFESKQKLTEFYESKELESRKKSVVCLTDGANSEEKEKVIRCATLSGQITLFTRNFGIGTNFICYDKILEENGGVHVIQTFLSQEQFEEIQIIGRTARQGDNGSFSMVLLDTDFERFLIKTKEIQEYKNKKGFFNQSNSMHSKEIYDRFCRERNTLLTTLHGTKTNFVAHWEKRHDATLKFVSGLHDGDITLIKEFLLEENRGEEYAPKSSRIIFLIEGTSSMIHLFHNFKNIIGKICDRIKNLSGKDSKNEDPFQIQFVIYGNYNNGHDKILQRSPWETKGYNLRQFLKTINLEKGSEYEAIEIGLNYVNKEHERQPIKQVVLIGSAPTNTKDSVRAGRSVFGEKYWKNTQFAQETYYEEELHKLKSKNIPVYTFFVNRHEENSFRQIANETKGRCKHLDINSPIGADTLEREVLEIILTNKGENSNRDGNINAFRTTIFSQAGSSPIASGETEPSQSKDSNEES
ncbi:unnamed protein product [Rotaria magnacalcarata]